MSQQWETVHARLLELAPGVMTLPANNVYDGPTTSRKYPPNYAVIGDDDNGEAGDFTQDYSDVGMMTDEQGVINCLFVARSGTEGFASLRAIASGWVDAWRAALFADKRLGVLPQGSLVNLGRVGIKQLMGDGGFGVVYVAQFTYFTRFQ